MKVIDSFIFYNELDLLLYRLTILDPYVDHFVLVESTRTFSGETKPLFYKDNKEIFNKFNHKIVHVVVDDCPIQTKVHDDRAWKNESFQRDCIKRGIDYLAPSLSDEDCIFTSDLDEICDPERMKELRNGTLEFDRTYLNRLELDMYYYNLNSRVQGGWHGLKLITYLAYKNVKLSFQDMRTWEHSHPVPIVKKGGWHLSYFGNASRIQMKLKSFSHQEFNYDQYTNLESIERNMNNSTDILYRSNFQLLKVAIKDNTYLPPQYETYLKHYVKY
jgi:beta-1,4-mannosyl-glycoprotein beta-1,4-N-acetylglucosaminyltransferase